MENESVSDANTEHEHKKGFLHRTLGGFYAWKRSIKANPVWGTLLAAVVLVIGILSNEAYEYGKRRLLGPDEFLVQIAASQKQEFADLEENLNKIGSSITDVDREAFNSVQSAVKSVEKTNTDLIQQLVMAKKENDTLSRITKQRAGISGGYDFILSVGSGIKIDATTVLGLTGTDSYNGDTVADVSLTSQDRAETKNDRLASGQSLTYKGNNQQSCTVSVLSVQDAGHRTGTASFAISCLPKHA